MNQSLIQVLQLLEPAALQAVQFLLAQLVAHVNHAADTHPANQTVGRHGSNGSGRNFGCFRDCGSRT